MPLHTGKGRSAATAISDILGYVENPEKTNGGRLITSYQCDSRTADAEFLFAKRQYIAKTGRNRGTDDVLAYQIRQSFVPGEITPEEANRLGRELAMRFTKETTPLLSAPTSTKLISITTSFSIRPPWTAPENSETSGAVPKPCGG